jgi:RNA polymerase sigma-70 factor (ECF subfamily)
MERPRTPPSEPWFRALYERHFDFVWRTLRHLGVREADLADACQEVFMIVYRRYPSFDAQAKVTTWLFQICFNKARERRRSAHARREVLGEAALDQARGPSDPFSELERQDKLVLFEAALDSMELEQRAAFILFEVEGMSGPEVAEALAVPLGTAYSRLRLAREAFQAALTRVRASTPAASPRKRGAR